MSRTSRSLAVFALTILTAAPLTAQDRPGATVTGRVLNTEERPLGSADIGLHTVGDSTRITSTLTGENGRFRLTGIPAGRYYLQVDHVGHGSRRTAGIELAAGDARDVGTIRLEVLSMELDSLEVSVERPAVAFEPDRTSYRVDAISEAMGGSISDAMMGIPELDVDIDGEVRLHGETPAIYVDGRPAPMSGVSLTVFLEQFPADQIESIEVIDNPSARYAAEGSGGIVNIVLKEGVELGVSGSVQFGTGTRGEKNLGGRITAQRGAWTVNGGLRTNWNNSDGGSFTLRQNLLADPVTFLEQDATSSSSSLGGGGDLRVRYRPDDKLSVSTRLRVSGRDSDRDGLIATSHLDQSQDPWLIYDRLERSDSDNLSTSFSADFEYEWIRRRHSLEVEVEGSMSGNSSLSQDEIGVDPDYLGEELLPPWLTEQNRESDDEGLGLTVDYTHPLGEEGRLEVGSRLRRGDDVSGRLTSAYLLPGDIDPMQESERDTRQLQTTSAAYLSVQQSFRDFGIQAGIRAESVDRDLTLPTGDVLERNDTDLFPSASLSWSPAQGKRFRLGYSQRVRRPGVNVLDPTDDSTDPLNRSVGNPDIESQITHRMSASFSLSGEYGSVSMRPYWNRTANGWERITTVDEEGVSTRTWANLSSRENLGASLSYRFRRIKGWGGYLSLSSSKTRLEGSSREVEGDFRWSARANLNGQLLGGLLAQGSFSYRPPRTLVQGRSDGRWQADFGFRYRFMERRASVRLSFRDPFELRKSGQRIEDDTVIETGRSRTSVRSISLGLSYAFGGGGGGRGRRGR